MRVFNWFPITSITFAAPIGEAFFVAFALPRGKFLGHKLPELHLPQDGMSGYVRFVQWGTPKIS